MYKREILSPVQSPVKDGAFLEGTWTKAFEDTDLLGLHRPYLLPVPKWIKELRIKEWQSFTVQNDSFCLAAMFSNVKYYHMVQVFLYNKNTQELLRFRKILPFGTWRLPRGLNNASVESRSYGLFFRIHNWLDAHLVKIEIDIKATRGRPSFTAQLEFDLDPKKTTPMAVSLPLVEKRCMYAFKALGNVRGDLVFGGNHFYVDPAGTLGLFCDFKGYFPYRMRSVWCLALGFDGSARRFGFSIAETQARETFKNNENAVWQDGALTPLPPVRITMPRGIESDWVIQDVEGMVDLTFTPKVTIRSGLGMIFSRFDYHTPLGYYNGILLNSNGEPIEVRNVWGLGEKLYLRV